MMSAIRLADNTIDRMNIIRDRLYGTKNKQKINTSSTWTEVYLAEVNRRVAKGKV